MMNQENRVVKTKMPRCQSITKNARTTNEKQLTAIDSAIYQTSAKLLQLTALKLKLEAGVNLRRVNE